MSFINDKEKMKDNIESFIKSKDYNDFFVVYILVDKTDSNNTIAVATNYDELIEINPNKQEIKPIMDWAYSIDEDIFGELEKNKEIGYMNIEQHYAMWHDINEYAPEDIEHKKGMQKYLKYCKENGITRERISKEIHRNIPDAMKHYKEKRAKER